MGKHAAFAAATRIGFAARGIMYGLIGYLALRSGRTEDGAGIIAWLDSGAGKLVLALMAAGFFAYGIWRLLDAWTDSSGHGHGTKGALVRAGGAVSGLLHIGLGLLALRHVLGGGGDGGDSSEQGAATALGYPGGGALLMLVAAGLLATGLYQLVKAWKLGFLKYLDADAPGRRWIAWLGRAGFAARGIVFLIVGWFFWRAGVEQSADQAGGLGEALDSLPPTLEMIVAAGLLLFGLFSLVEARYRRLPRDSLGTV